MIQSRCFILARLSWNHKEKDFDSSIRSKKNTENMAYQTFGKDFGWTMLLSFRFFYVLIYCLKERVSIVHKGKS